MMQDEKQYICEQIDEYSRYKIGETVSQYNPADEPVRYMLFLVAYDIRDEKRLNKVAKKCEDYGFRVEYSVFECDIPEEIFLELWNELLLLINPEEDSLLAYRICGNCVKTIQSAGNVVRPEKSLIYLV